MSDSSWDICAGFGLFCQHSVSLVILRISPSASRESHRPRQCQFPMELVKTTKKCITALNSYATTDAGLQSEGSYLHSRGPEALKPSALQWQLCLKDKIECYLFVWVTTLINNTQVPHHDSNTVKVFGEERECLLITTSDLEHKQPWLKTPLCQQASSKCCCSLGITGQRHHGFNNTFSNKVLLPWWRRHATSIFNLFNAEIRAGAKSFQFLRKRCEVATSPPFSLQRV